MPSVAGRSRKVDVGPVTRGDASTAYALAGLLAVAFLVRLVFLPADGFHSDVSTFEAWALQLGSGTLRGFYGKAGFADYPPGYFFVLWALGHIYKLFAQSDPGYGLLKILVKLPAVFSDLICAGLIFAIVRRFASLPWAFGAAALFALNPASIFVSAYWGQVDSVAMVFTLLAVYLVLVALANPGPAGMRALAGAWLALAASILIKPPAIVLVPLLLALVFACGDPRERLRRALATGAGIALAFALAYLSALAFHPGANPIAQYVWLYGRYQYAANVYPYSSVNAFNLYAMLHNFWESDAQTLPNWSFGRFTFALPQYEWGILLLLALVGLVVTAFVQRRDEDRSTAFLEGAMILSLGYFIFSTRMHERYIFNAFVLAMPLIWLRRRYLYAAVILSLTLLANLFYSLHYLHAVEDRLPGVDATNLWPLVSHPAAILNVALFLYLGWTYLGTGADPLERLDLGGLMRSGTLAARRWFVPLEGVAAMTRLDWVWASLLTVGTFAVSLIRYTFPPEKYFDEIYYARAAEEYIHHKEIFEFTHPPLSKLIITLSTIMLGDSGAGWRFLNIVVGALMVLVMYAFAKRLLGSTPFAIVAAGMLALDGFRFVQSRIATPEITVAFFSLLTLYAFYRFWLAAQVRVAPLVASVGAALRYEGLMFGVMTVVAAAITEVAVGGQSVAARIVLFLYIECGFYVAVRLLAPVLRKSPPLVSYAEGSRLAGNVLEVPDGARVPLERGQVTAGSGTEVVKNGLVYTDGELRIEYARDGSARYRTPEGEAEFAPAGTMRAGPARTDGARDGRIWLWVLALVAGCLGASKWNGLFDFFVVWAWVGIVALQRFWPIASRAMGRRNLTLRPAVWGNPSGFSADVVLTAMLFVGASIYLLCYIPYFSLGHNFGDVVDLQRQMYMYHCCTPSVVVANGAHHPYMSEWWQWPLLQIPISYYYHDFRTGAALANPHACCLAEILALPNPAVWWLGLVSVPMMCWWAWRERNKGYAILATAYFFQWLPWVGSPRLVFEYHFFPNLALIVLADAILLQRLWNLAAKDREAFVWLRPSLVAFGVVVVLAFIFWYPVLSGTPIAYDAWHARMLTWLEGNNWILPHPG